MDMGTVQTGYKQIFLHSGMLFVRRGDFRIVTILGSCVSVCLWDPEMKMGGINHYLLPLWNGEGLPSPRYGNIAIAKLIEQMLSNGSKKRNLKAKLFGGSSIAKNTRGLLSVGKRNIILAVDVLKDMGIPIISSDIGGTNGRKIIFHTESGTILLKKIKTSDNTRNP